jgi:5'-deoxynucleotidase YfbR-like HD superfamily hydrolase
MKKNSSISWKNRDQDLRNIKRYSKFTVMFYRTNDLIHSQRVKALLEEILPFVKELYPEIDVKKAKLIAKHHDDYEIILDGGDISLQLKLMMDEYEHNILQQKEIYAVDILSQFYPKKINGYLYEQILLHSIYKDCIEAQLVSFVDKIDGYCEAIHEVLAGNTIFLEPIINYNLKTFNNLREKYPLIKKIFDLKNVWFEFHVVDLKVFFEDGNIGSYLYTEETIKKETYILQYERWKKVTLKKFGVQQLTNQVEFHKAH